MKFKPIIVLLFIFSPLPHAGEHHRKLDDFTGEVTNVFATTTREVESNRALYAISGYNKNRNTVSLIVQPLSGLTSCNKKYLLLKDSAGVIHKLAAEEHEFKMCIVSGLDADLVRKPFKVRIPLYNRADLDIEVDTTTLDLSKLLVIEKLVITEKEWLVIFQIFSYKGDDDYHDYLNRITSHSTKLLRSASQMLVLKEKNTEGYYSGIKEGLTGHLLSWYVSELSLFRGSSDWRENRAALLDNRRAFVSSGLIDSDALESSFINMNKATRTLALPTIKRLN